MNWWDNALPFCSAVSSSAISLASSAQGILMDHQVSSSFNPSS
jgi:hypothetical protein